MFFAVLAQCPPLSEIANGIISYFPDNTPDYNIGTVAFYSCNQGYELRGGNVIRTCADADGRGGAFIEQAPTCERKQLNACAVNAKIL